MRVRGFFLLSFLLLAGCRSETPAPEGLNTRAVKLPNGEQVRCEVMVQEFDMRRGFMFRESVPRGTGMLFLHQKPGQYSYWMYQVKVPLDIIWMSSSRRIVEIAANVPPCGTKASECPQYGGHVEAQYVLELGGGEAQRYGLREGDLLSF